MKNLLFIFLLPVALGAQAQYPADTYLEELRLWLRENTYDGSHSDLGYNQARIEMYGFVDENEGTIACVYTGFEQMSEAVTFPDPMNTEHVVPQSLFGNASPMRSDIHVLRPTHGDANSARANFPFGEVADEDAQWYGIDGAGAYFTTATQPANDVAFSELFDGVWEPREDRKGDIARQVFYFFTMYPDLGFDIASMGNLEMLYDWHLADPASLEEVLRNDRIEAVQGNRNPYIDFEELVYDAWLWETEPVVLGCTYALAMNFNQDANDDDGSCVFDFTGCQGDLDGDGQVTVSDMVTLLGVFGSVCE